MSFPESNEPPHDNTNHELAAQKEQILRQVLAPEAPFQLVFYGKELTMKTQLSKLLRASALTACVFAISPNAFAESLEDEELRTQLLNTLENLEATADGLNITAVMEE